jgi:hypothetical protein
MARTIIAVFDSMFSAKKALVELEEYGVSGDMIQVFSRPARSKTIEIPAKAKKVQMEVEVGGQSAGMCIGAGIGSAIGLAGGLMAAFGALPLLGFSAADPLSGAATVLAATGTAALAGGLFGLLLGGSLDTGIPETELHQYARAVRSDEVVVAVLADWDAVDSVVQLIQRNTPLRLEERSFRKLRPGQVGGTPSAQKAQAKAVAKAEKREDRQ